MGIVRNTFIDAAPEPMVLSQAGARKRSHSVPMHICSRRCSGSLSKASLAIEPCIRPRSDSEDTESTAEGVGSNLDEYESDALEDDMCSTPTPRLPFCLNAPGPCEDLGNEALPFVAAAVQGSQRLCSWIFPPPVRQEQVQFGSSEHRKVPSLTTMPLSSAWIDSSQCFARVGVPKRHPVCTQAQSVLPR